jgi:hypothetical protein
MANSASDMFAALLAALRGMRAELRLYNAVPMQYSRSQQVNLYRPCNGWTVINKGSTNVTVNGILVLAPDEFIAVGGNEGEAYTGFLRLSFVSNTDPGNNAIVYQKFYETGEGKYDKANM